MWPPLKDPMLLGMDYLPDCKAKLDLEDGTLILEGDRNVMSIIWGSPRDPSPCFPSNVSGGGRYRFLGIQESRIVSASEEDRDDPLPKLGSWTSKREMLKNPAAFEVSSQGAVDEAPEIESKLKVFRSSTPTESAKGPRDQGAVGNVSDNAPCPTTLEPQPTSV